jgi:hypothetical protein
MVSGAVMALRADAMRSRRRSRAYPDTLGGMLREIHCLRHAVRDFMLKFHARDDAEGGPWTKSPREV